MSHSVTITRTTTTTGTTSAVIINTGYVKTIPGILKLAQLILGIVVVTIIAIYYEQLGYALKSELFFFLMAVAFLIGTFCLLLACLFSLSTGGIISKTLYEFIYHSVATILYTIATVFFAIDLKYYKRYGHYDAYVAAAVLGGILAILYLASTIYARRSYRGI